MIESIVLLKNELGLDCIDWDGLLYLYQSNDYEPSANTPLNNQIKNWNEVILLQFQQLKIKRFQLDWELYQHFNTTLTRKIKQFGADKLVDQVAQYELRLDEISAQCQDGSRNTYCSGQLCFDLCYGSLTEEDVLKFIRN